MDVATSQSGREKRSHPRLPLNILVQFRMPTMDDFMRQVAVNVSAGGMFIRTETPHPIGSKIYLQFRLEDGVKIIEGLGEVVHVNTPESPHPGMGVEFVSLDGESKKFIDSLVAERLAEMAEFER